MDYRRIILRHKTRPNSDKNTFEKCKILGRWLKFENIRLTSTKII